MKDDTKPTITTVTTPWGCGDFMPNPQHTIQVRDEGEKGYCARCGDEVNWSGCKGFFAPSNLVHTTVEFEVYRDCYTPQLPDRYIDILRKIKETRGA